MKTVYSKIERKGICWWQPDINNSLYIKIEYLTMAGLLKEHKNMIANYVEFSGGRMRWKILQFLQSKFGIKHIFN